MVNDLEHLRSLIRFIGAILNDPNSTDERARQDCIAVINAAEPMINHGIEAVIKQSMTEFLRVTSRPGHP